MISLLELHVEEAIWAFLLLVDLGHHAVRRQDLAPVDEEGDGGFLAQAHSFADDRVKLDGLEVVWDQEPTTTEKTKR